MREAYMNTENRNLAKPIPIFSRNYIRSFILQNNMNMQSPRKVEPVSKRNYA